MSAPLISFKAGRIDYNDDTKEAVPKRGQGTVKITKNPDEPSFYSFVWEPRGKYKKTVGANENDELLLFPGDAEWKHIKQCTTGRAYALTFKSSGQKLMFWLQTPGADDDIATLTADDKAISESISKILDEESMMEEDANEDIELADATDEPAPASNR
jgi:26S proteasome regulatory subunit N13